MIAKRLKVILMGLSLQRVIMLKYKLLNFCFILSKQINSNSLKLIVYQTKYIMTKQDQIISSSSMTQSTEWLKENEQIKNKLKQYHKINAKDIKKKASLLGKQKIYPISEYIYVGIWLIQRVLNNIFVMILFSIIALIVISSQVLCQGESNIKINETLNIMLQPFQTQYLKLDIDADPSFIQNIYVIAEPKIEDPFQIPYLDIQSTNNFSLSCYQSQIQFSGICIIPLELIQKNQQFNISVKCTVACDILLRVTMSALHILRPGEIVNLASFDSDSIELIIYQIPPNIKFDYIMILAKIQNIEDINEGIEIYANYGKDSIDIPNQKKYSIKGTSFYNGGRTLFLSNKSIEAGQWIKMYIQISSKMRVSLTSYIIKNELYEIKIGKSYFDYAPMNTTKIYFLNASKLNNTAQGKSIQIVFQIYSGYPKIEISFNSSFQIIIPFKQQASSANYILSPSIQNQYKFNNSVFIKITTNISAAQYYFTSGINSKQYVDFEVGIAQFDSLQKGQIENYLMKEEYVIEKSIFEKQNQIYRNYTFTVQVTSGQGSFHFTRCSPLERFTNSTNFSCLITSKQNLSQQFKKGQISAKKMSIGNLITYIVNFDIKQCSWQNKNEKYAIECVFQLIGLADSSEPFIFSITAQRMFYRTYLKQNARRQDYIVKQTYLFYAFSLPSQQNISEINIFVTTLSGQTALIVSTKQQFPTFTTKQKDRKTQSGEHSSITLTKDELSETIYISVYAYDYTSINIGVIVHRNISESEFGNSINLFQNSMLLYTMKQKQKNINFTFNSKLLTDITVHLNELIGNLQFRIFKDSRQIGCYQKDDRHLCRFNSTINSRYQIVVIGLGNKIQKFTISYFNSSKCLIASLNQPLFITLNPSSELCYTFLINRAVPLQISTSLSAVQNLNKQVLLTIQINQEMVKSITKKDYKIGLNILNHFCRWNRKDQKDTCSVTITYQNIANVSNSFYIILQQEDAEIALFDGISEKVQNYLIEKDAKYLYYHVYSKNTIKIFFTTPNYISYYLGCKLVQKQAFLSRNASDDSIYLPNKDSILNQNISQQKVNLFEQIINTTGISILTISDEFIAEFCQNSCYLTISIYYHNVDTNQFFEPDYFQIEVSQNQTYLPLASSKIAYVDYQQIYTYLIDAADSIIEIRDLYQQTSMNSPCFSAFATSADEKLLLHINQGILYLSKSKKIQKVFIKGQRNQCSFQISYYSANFSIMELKLSTPYKIFLNESSVQAFIYYHHNYKSFRIVEFVNVGDSVVYVKPLRQKQNSATSSLLNLNYTIFPFNNKQSGGELLIQSSSSDFCSECYYYVVVQASSKALIEEIMIVRKGDPISLTTNALMKGELIPNSSKSDEDFVFFSMVDFTLICHIMSGFLEITIIDPNYSILYSENINSTTQFKVQGPRFTNFQKQQYFSARTRFKIKLKSILATSYNIQIGKNRITDRIFEGLPALIQFQEQQFKTIEFTNSRQLNQSLSLMLDFSTNINSTVLNLNASAISYQDSTQIYDNEQIIEDFVRTNHSISLAFKNLNTTYFITVYSSQAVNISFLLLKQAFNQIAPNNNYLFNSTSILALYTPSKNIAVQILPCFGDFDIKISKKYKGLNKNNSGDSIPNLRINYRNHYLLGLENVDGRYFIKVVNKDQKKKMAFMASYYYYNVGDWNPFDRIILNDYDLSYRLDNQLLTIFGSKTKYLQDSQKISVQNISYIIYFCSQRQALISYMKCGIEGDVTSIVANESNIQINMSSIKNKQQPLFISLKASIHLKISSQYNERPQTYPQTLTIFYNTLQIRLNQNTVSQDSYLRRPNGLLSNPPLLLLWLAISIVILLLGLIYIVRCFMYKVRNRRKQMVQQIEIVAASANFPTEDKIENGRAIVGTDGNFITNQL